MSTSPYVPGPQAAPLPQVTPAARNPLGTASLILGVVLLVWNVASVALQAAAIASRDMAQLGLLSLFGGILVFLVAGSALACGIAGLLVRDRPRIRAGIGTGIAAASLVGLLSSLAYSALIPLFSG